ncbi:MAG TPA: hypothetical protein VFK04_19125 [Gemmatimonadaceae bacterium]|nr:hypothetical protein [Gemmatimonadaceae bacterium]
MADTEQTDPGAERARAVGIGCLMAVPGFFGGGMIAVAVGRLVESVTGCTPPEGLPACHTGLYLLVGGLTGLVLLPTVVVWRLRRRSRTTGNSERS